MNKCKISFLSLIFSLLLPLPATAQTQVIIYEAKKQQLFDVIEALGTLRANETVMLTATVTDTISGIHFEDGQRVEKGTVLVEMMDEEEVALTKEMTALAAEAKRQYERLQNLPKSGAVSEALLDQKNREYKAATAQLEAMKSRVKDRRLLAPFNGVVGLRIVSVGALVAPGDEIVTVTDDSLMKLDFSVPAVFLSSLEKGLAVTAHTAAYPDREFSGTVSAIDSRVDPVSRSIIVRAEIPNPDRLLKPGLLMTVALKHNPREALIIPEEALIPQGSEKSVYVVSGNPPAAEKIEIKTGTRRPGEVEVVSGLQEGDKIVTHGILHLQPGAPVSIMAVQRGGEGIQDILKRLKTES